MQEPKDKDLYTLIYIFYTLFDDYCAESGACRFKLLCFTVYKAAGLQPGQSSHTTDILVCNQAIKCEYFLEKIEIKNKLSMQINLCPALNLFFLQVRKANSRFEPLMFSIDFLSIHNTYCNKFRQRPISPNDLRGVKIRR